MRPRVLSLRHVCPAKQLHKRLASPIAYSTQAAPGTTTTDQVPKTSNRWHADLKQRIGKCIIWGCEPNQARKAATVARVLGEEWRSLMAGAEGYLTRNSGEDKKSRGSGGLEDREVTWGEMDAFVCHATLLPRYALTSRVMRCSNMSTMSIISAGLSPLASTGSRISRSSIQQTASSGGSL
jgi:hypothetical protein